MASLWPRLAEATLHSNPSPYWSLDPALPVSLYNQLRSEWPPDELFLRGRSVLVLFLNGPESIHAVTRRRPTPHKRRFLNLIGQAPRPLFNVDRYQIPRRKYLARLFQDRYVDQSEFGFGARRL